MSFAGGETANYLNRCLWKRWKNSAASSHGVWTLCNTKSKELRSSVYYLPLAACLCRVRRREIKIVPRLIIIILFISKLYVYVSNLRSIPPRAEEYAHSKSEGNIYFVNSIPSLNFQFLPLRKLRILLDRVIKLKVLRFFY